jgi:hypothetical protein
VVFCVGLKYLIGGKKVLEKIFFFVIIMLFL